MKALLLSTIMVGIVCISQANDKDTTTNKKVDDKELREFAALYAKLDSTEKIVEYKTGLIKLENGVANVNIPKGFKFIGAKQSQYILQDLWENLPDPSVMGMIVPDSFRVNSLTSTWTFIVSYDALGYVKDHDADDINYDNLLKDMKAEQLKANEERKKMGYDAMELIGWASKPFYDKENKVLHWAKEYKVSGSESNTLNYDIRVLGRKGVLSLNAIGTMDQLEEVKKQIPAILKMSDFEAGYKYADFNPDIDEVAAWTIGGLVAGKILAKVGLLAIFLKAWKLILIGVTTVGGAIWRFITGRRKSDDYSVENLSEGNNG